MFPFVSLFTLSSQRINGHNFLSSAPCLPTAPPPSLTPHLFSLSSAFINFLHVSSTMAPRGKGKGGSASAARAPLAKVNANNAGRVHASASASTIRSTSLRRSSSHATRKGKGARRTPESTDEVNLYRCSVGINTFPARCSALSNSRLRLRAQTRPLVFDDKKKKLARALSYFRRFRRCTSGNHSIPAPGSSSFSCSRPMAFGSFRASGDHLLSEEPSSFVLLETS